MKYGMNLLLWTAELNEHILPTLESLKQMGYDGIEIPLFNLDLDYAAWGKRLDDVGLERTAVTVRTAADNPISAPPNSDANGVNSVIVPLAPAGFYSEKRIKRAYTESRRQNQHRAKHYGNGCCCRSLRHSDVGHKGRNYQHQADNET